MKTPMQELVDWITSTTDYEFRTQLGTKIKDGLEKEKQMIIDAYEDGIIERIERENSHLMCKHNAVSSEQYYNETFKND
jgi:hypothetical protein